LLIINYDEWGGFYDHVAPPFAPVTPEEFALIGNDGRLGFRVPAYLIGPRARRGHVSHVQFDHNSILNFICWRFGMEPLGARGDTSLNIAHALDFSSPPNLEAPGFSVPIGPFGLACGLPVPKNASAVTNPYAKHESEWQGLYEVVRKLGYLVR
jgi:phospholipase C